MLLEDNDYEYEVFETPMSKNKRKSLAPLFVYLILEKGSGPEQHLTQKQIIELLHNMPYELDIDRRALSRIIHTLADENLYIYCDKKTGVWME